MRRSGVAPAFLGRGWAATGTIGVSIGTAALLANLSNRFCRRMRYSSSLFSTINKTIEVESKKYTLQKTFGICDRQLIKTLSQGYPKVNQQEIRRSLAGSPFLRDGISVFPR